LGIGAQNSDKIASFLVAKAIGKNRYGAKASHFGVLPTQDDGGEHRLEDRQRPFALGRHT
jgi:hypothetical protein